MRIMEKVTRKNLSVCNKLRSLNMIKKRMILSLVVLIVAITGVLAAGKTEAIQASKGPVRIELWSSLSGSKAKVFDSQVAAFNAVQNEVLVDVIHQGGYSVLRQKVAAAANAKNMPTLLIVDYLDVAWYAQLGLVQSVEDVLPASVISDYYESMLEDLRYEGKLYGIPYNRSTQGFFVNNDVLKKAGIQETASTWDEFLADAKQMKALGSDYYYGYAFFHQFLFDAIAYSWGADVSTADGKVNLNSDELIQMFTYFQNAYEQGLLLMPPVLVGGFEEQNGAFLDGKVATVFQTTSFFPTAQSLLKNFNWSFEFLPAGTGGNAITIGGGNFAVTSGASVTQAEAAGKFLTFMSSPEIVAEFFIGTGNLPTRKSAMMLPVVKDYLAANPKAAKMVEQLAFGKPAPSITKNIRDVFMRTNDLISRIILNGENPKAVLDEYTVLYQNEIDEAKANGEFIY